MSWVQAPESEQADVEEPEEELLGGVFARPAGAAPKATATSSAITINLAQRTAQAPPFASQSLLAVHPPCLLHGLLDPHFCKAACCSREP